MCQGLSCNVSGSHSACWDEGYSPQLLCRQEQHFSASAQARLQRQRFVFVLVNTIVSYRTEIPQRADKAS